VSDHPAHPDAPGAGQQEPSPPPSGGVFVPGAGGFVPGAGGFVPGAGGERSRFVVRSRVMDVEDVARAVRRMAHEIAERNRGLTDVVLVGLHRGGVWLAGELADALERIEGVRVPKGVLDVAFHRDDINIRRVMPHGVSDVPTELTGHVVVLADDVLFTGRTVRAALDALNDYGRPRAVQLAVLVDRGHRELPIRPDFVGKNLPTRRDEYVRVSADAVEIGEFEVGEIDV
jgi:pyrimidine operon attenuation protein / uracil phosphoribosyltransferase